MLCLFHCCVRTVFWTVKAFHVAWTPFDTCQYDLCCSSSVRQAFAHTHIAMMTKIQLIGQH